MNRFYYLLYKHYKNSCTASVILYDVFLFSTFEKMHSVSLFEVAETHEALLVVLLHLWTGETIINRERKATNFVN